MSSNLLTLSLLFAIVKIVSFTLWKMVTVFRRDRLLLLLSLFEVQTVGCFCRYVTSSPVRVE